MGYYKQETITDWTPEPDNVETRRQEAGFHTIKKPSPKPVTIHVAYDELPAEFMPTRRLRRQIEQLSQGRRVEKSRTIVIAICGAVFFVALGIVIGGAL